MDRLNRRLLGGLGGGLLLLAVLLPFYARGSIMNDDLETLSLLAVSPWLGMAAVTCALAAIAFAVAHRSGLQWIPGGGALAVLAGGLIPYRPYDYGVSLGVWTMLGVLAMLTLAAAWRRPAPRAA